MSEGAYMAKYFYSDASADDEVQAMARRQFGVSLVVGLTLLVAAVAIEGRAAQITHSEFAAQSRIAHPEATHFDIGQPVFGAKAPG
jgi:hypothetical protein